MKILITVPYPPTSQNGNSVSGRRIRDIFIELGHQAELVETPATFDSFSNIDLLLALNAKKSAAGPQKFKQQFPDKPVAVFLTGTDLHTHLDQGGKEASIVVDNLAIADAIVVSQSESLLSIPKVFVEKSIVVPKSIAVKVPTYRPNPVDRPLIVVAAFHFRKVKNPEQLVRMAERSGANMELHLFGRIGDSAEEKLFLQETNPIRNFLWHGEVSRPIFLNHLSNAHVYLNTSLVEGGSNALLEAMEIGVPVLASNIAGNRGLLGEDYLGYFEPGNDAELNALLGKCKRRDFRDQLCVDYKNRLSIFSYPSERQAWKSFVEHWT